MTMPLQRVHLEHLAERAETERLLIATDLDGTLTPIVSNPDSVRIPQETAETLLGLMETGRVVLAIVSGRQLDDLASRVSLPAILSGNHGFEIEGPGISFRHPLAEERTSLIADAADAIGSVISQWNGAWVENKRFTATVHYRHVDQRHHYDIAIAIRRAVAPFGSNLGLRAGKCSLEIHPRVGWNKGSAVSHIREQLGLEGSPVLCLGDDKTDETMFRSLSGHVTVCVGQNVRTAAAYHVPDAHSVGHVLRTLYEIVTGQPEVLRTTA